MNYFVTAIGTDSGKTLISAILTEMLECNYWKPVQAGEPRDTLEVKRLVSNNSSRFEKEAFVLNTPASPHYAAAIDGVHLTLEAISLPSDEEMVIEGAGGLLVPLNDQDTIADLIPRLNAEIILVSNLYLGSINHTLLTIEELHRRDLKVKGIIFNGESNPASEDIILKKSGYRRLLDVPRLTQVNAAEVRRLANELKRNWYVS